MRRRRRMAPQMSIRCCGRRPSCAHRSWPTTCSTSWTATACPCGPRSPRRSMRCTNCWGPDPDRCFAVAARHSEELKMPTEYLCRACNEWGINDVQCQFCKKPLKNPDSREVQQAPNPQPWQAGQGVGGGQPLPQGQRLGGQRVGQPMPARQHFDDPAQAQPQPRPQAQGVGGPGQGQPPLPLRQGGGGQGAGQPWGGVPQGQPGGPFGHPRVGVPQGQPGGPFGQPRGGVPQGQPGGPFGQPRGGVPQGQLGGPFGQPRVGVPQGQPGGPFGQPRGGVPQGQPGGPFGQPWGGVPQGQPGGQFGQPRGGVPQGQPGGPFGQPRGGVPQGQLGGPFGQPRVGVPQGQPGGPFGQPRGGVPQGQPGGPFGQPRGGVPQGQPGGQFGQPRGGVPQGQPGSQFGQPRGGVPQGQPGGQFGQPRGGVPQGQPGSQFGQPRGGGPARTGRQGPTAFAQQFAIKLGAKTKAQEQRAAANQDLKDRLDRLSGIANGNDAKLKQDIAEGASKELSDMDDRTLKALGQNPAAAAAMIARLSCFKVVKVVGDKRILCPPPEQMEVLAKLYRVIELDPEFEDGDRTHRAAVLNALSGDEVEAM